MFAAVGKSDYICTEMFITIILKDNADGNRGSQNKYQSFIYK